MNLKTNENLLKNADLLAITRGGKYILEGTFLHFPLSFCSIF